MLAMPNRFAPGSPRWRTLRRRWECLMQGRPAFRAHRWANQKDNKLARLGHQRDDDHTRAPIHLTGQDRGWQQDSQRERERERGKPQRAGPTGGRGQTPRRVLISLLHFRPPTRPSAHSTHHGGWASGLRFKNALINPIGFTGGSNSGRTPALDRMTTLKEIRPVVV